jgi:hypothetical protein
MANEYESEINYRLEMLNNIVEDKVDIEQYCFERDQISDDELP